MSDPRVLFAAERTLLAWNRTSLALIGFGFLIERFGLFLRMFGRNMAAAPVADAMALPQTGASTWLGLSFAILGSAFALLSVLQYRRLLKTLNPADVPQGYWTQLAAINNLAVAVLGLVLAGYLAYLR